MIRKHKKNSTSIVFKYQNVNNMIFIYDYFMINRLYSDFKFYRTLEGGGSLEGPPPSRLYN